MEKRISVIPSLERRFRVKSIRGLAKLWTMPRALAVLVLVVAGGAAVLALGIAVAALRSDGV